MKWFPSIVLVSIILAVLLSGCTDAGKIPIEEEYCAKDDTDEKMSLSEAIQIANASDCVKEGALKETHECNEFTGTWWIDLDIKEEGCNPACVVKVDTKETVINWRCTGLIT